MGNFVKMDLKNKLLYIKRTRIPPEELYLSDYLYKLIPYYDENDVINKNIFYKAERKTHPSERGWDVSDH